MWVECLLGQNLFIKSQVSYDFIILISEVSGRQHILAFNSAQLGNADNTGLTAPRDIGVSI